MIRTSLQDYLEPPRSEVFKEAGEHPSLPMQAIEQIARDHQGMADGGQVPVSAPPPIPQDLVPQALSRALAAPAELNNAITGAASGAAKFLEPEPLPGEAQDMGDALLTNKPVSGFHRSAARYAPQVLGGLAGNIAGAAGGLAGVAAGGVLGASAGEAARQAVANGLAGWFQGQDLPMNSPKQVLGEVGDAAQNAAIGEGLGLGAAGLSKAAELGPRGTWDALKAANEALGESGKIDPNLGSWLKKAPGLEAEKEAYQGLHTPPDRTYGAPAHDLTGGGDIYPDDVYGPNAVQYYGTGEPQMDATSFQIARSLKGRPNATVKIYRAVPDVPNLAGKISEIERQQAYILKHGEIPPGVETNLDRSKYYDLLHDELSKLKELPPEAPAKKSGINDGDWVTINRDYAKQHGESALNGNYKILSKNVKAKDIITNGDSIHEWGYRPEPKKQILPGASSANLDNPNFKEWFGKSKLVDKSGKPLTVYHGTDKDFVKFDKNKSADSYTWFSSDPEVASEYSLGRSKSGEGANIKPLHAKMENPAGVEEYDRYSPDELKQMGYDGVLLKEKDGSFTGFVFDENKQLKSATGNSGKYDPKKASIVAGGLGAYLAGKQATKD